MARDTWGTTGSDTDDSSRFIDSSGDLPALRVAKLTMAAFATVVLGYLWGLLDWITAIGGGITSTINSLGVGATQAIDGLWALGTDPLGPAFEANAAFLSIFGTWAQAVAVIELAAFAYLLLWALDTLGSAFMGGGG